MLNTTFKNKKTKREKTLFKFLGNYMTKNHNSLVNHLLRTKTASPYQIQGKDRDKCLSKDTIQEAKSSKNYH